MRISWVTSFKWEEQEREHGIFEDDLFSGVLVSDCLLPCLRTVAHVKAGTSIKQEGIQLIIFFNEEVRIMRTTIDTFSSIESLNILGSNLGLWPGLGKVLYCRRHVDTHIWKAHRTRGHTKPGQRGTNNVHLLFQSAQTIKYSNFLHSLAPFVLCALIFINFSKNFWNILHLICQV